MKFTITIDIDGVDAEPKVSIVQEPVITTPAVTALPMNCGMFTDCRDNKTYKTVKMPDGKVWLAENLKFKVDNSWYYNDGKSKIKNYGRLYTWAAAKAATPIGWHLPTREEWAELIGVCGGEKVASMCLKASSGWNYGCGTNRNGTDEYGFSALPCGFRSTDGDFSGAGNLGYWWTATEDTVAMAYYQGMGYDRDGDHADEYVGFKAGGLSVRCIQDAPCN
jgi:uncharacterized protein (TIGR02145 family)